MNKILILGFVCFLLIFTVFPSLSLGGEISFNPPIIKIVLEEGDATSQTINVINDFDTDIEFSVFLSSESSFISADRSRFFVKGGESNSLSLSVSSDLDPGVYSGSVALVSDREQISVPVIVEVETFSPIFDVTTEVTSQSADVSPGESFLVDITIYKLKESENEAKLEYFVKDLEGKVVFSESQVYGINNQLKISQSVPISSELEGNYVFSAVVNDLNSVSLGTSSFLFSVGDRGVVQFEPETEPAFDIYLISSFVIILILIISFLAFNHYWNRRVISHSQKWKERVAEIKKFKYGDVAKKIGKLENQKRLLNTAYSKGYIKKNSYDESKREINKVLSNLKKRL